MKVLTSPRLKLRKLVIEDAEFIVELLTDPDSLKYIGDRGVKNIKDAVAYIQQGPQSMYKQFGLGLLLVESLEHQTPIGLCGLLKRPELSHPDIGFAFLPAYRKQGFASEATKLVLDDAIERKVSEKILAITSVDNHKSIHLLKKLGFNFKELMQLAASSSNEVNLFELLVKT